jgi:RNA polymerase sigma-70 factor (ECF subfamily)
VRAETTQLLTRAAYGDQAAAARLTPLVYDELRGLAGWLLVGRGENGCALLEPTALVHEAFLRLVDRETADFRSRTHFCALAAAAMRHVLIDYARGGRRAKRGGDWQRITLSGAEELFSSDEVDLLALNEALAELGTLDPRAARVVELRFFGGLTEGQVGAELGVSERTVRNDWSMARAWLRTQLADDTEEQPS